MFLGLEIGGTKLQFVIGDDDGRVVDRRRFDVQPARGAEGIREQITTAMEQLRRAYPLRAAGVGFGGPVDWKTGRICRSHQVEGWSEFPIGEWLGTLAGVPAVVDNDANVAALGEALCGAGRGRDPVFYVTLGSGVGGGLVVGGSIYHGVTPGEAEIGHIRLDRRGTIVESRCSGWAVDARIRELKQRDPASRLAQLAAGATRGEAHFLAPALAEGDPAARQILAEIADDLAFALSHATHLFHPAVIVLGGGLSLVGEPLRAAVAEVLPRYLMEVFSPGPEIRLAVLAEDAVPVGALRLCSRFG